jgi:hypothetical protein
MIPGPVLLSRDMSQSWSPSEMLNRRDDGDTDMSKPRFEPVFIASCASDSTLVGDQFSACVLY